MNNIQSFSSTLTTYKQIFKSLFHISLLFTIDLIPTLHRLKQVWLQEEDQVQCDMLRCPILALWTTAGVGELYPDESAVLVPLLTSPDPVLAPMKHDNDDVYYYLLQFDSC